MVNTNENARRDIQDIKKKESKHSTLESHQHTRCEWKRIKKKKTTKVIGNSKMVILHTYQ